MRKKCLVLFDGNLLEKYLILIKLETKEYDELFLKNKDKNIPKEKTVKNLNNSDIESVPATHPKTVSNLLKFII